MRRPRKSEDYNEFAFVKKFSDSERRFKDFKGNQGVALIFPSSYKVASSSLSWSWVQQLFWEQGVFPERYFYEKWFKKFYSVESFKPLDENKILMFSLHFELNFENVLDILKKLKVPLLSKDRDVNSPVVIIGGAITFFNEEIITPIADVVVKGDLEKKVKFVSEGIRLLLKNKVEGLEYFKNIKNDLSNFDIGQKLPASHFLTPFSEFGEKRLIEIGRGCIRRCKFCVMGYNKKPVKFVRPSIIEEFVKNEKNPIGVISATITDYPWLDDLLDILEEYNIEFSVSSMRADGITERLLCLLKKSGQRTYTIAPEGISQRIRDILLKDIDVEELYSALETGRKVGFKSVKFYYIVGLGEGKDDLGEMKEFINNVKKMGYKSISLSVNPLIPKRRTPFYGRKIISEKEYNNMKKWFYENLRGIKINFESYRLSKKQYDFNVMNENDIVEFVKRRY
ncbi:radical SAM protein [Thermosipho melanesiensis]|uniref:Radical SAM domain protein n=2 Tax=Thermosipho melanesiensis TaxID=46541 RepID=A6LJH7_THEM4|nr:radical SAM protein [Thermosipho melanesiensis]ABR30078.1 Radical SAM domain protein [Thermosipho melanesiensis BI429]APT73275.1 radical SAM protein [Thermosipho melanesiensis]OOC38668.1 radical SAM protein [Thermosipho melanesiensis]OOC40472.1 radical SAM protein [Thermosipho melanesiensis]OOC40737.1 radical SAM protein [Thermosipho melanesiensis]